jgi:hypothetical protein
MSRTFRRRHTTQNGMWSDLEYYTSERVYPFESYGWYRSSVLVPFERGSKEYKKGKARFHSDMGTTSFKEPGPHWFRNLFSDRPLRRHDKNELKKFMLDPEYEPMCNAYWKLDYWT